ncbi:hypothetical protein O181_010047 [Austropuccinia psidii MF-1]|uniref:Uncharacterized protein n=1 Tax=Austropuccinia psidii MF-1 TaxID=1389203 RepID=A0A9Q3BRU8_9BASI|nr:hypothetical protein [Austropuccinia psidii MF-1]
MILMQDQKSPWEVVHMDWCKALPPRGEKSYNPFLVTVARYRKTPILLPFHNNDSAMDSALGLYTRVLSHTELFKNIISGRDPKFTSALCTNIH